MTEEKKIEDMTLQELVYKAYLLRNEANAIQKQLMAANQQITKKEKEVVDKNK